MKLDVLLNNLLDEYTGMIDQGTIDMGSLELTLAMLTNKDEARRLAHKIMKMAKPNEIKKALQMGKEHPNRMAYWFVQALEEKKPKKVKAKT
jgi:hypothetical protein